jgi:phospholipase C
VLISPWSRRGFVNSTLFDHTSILRLIEWRWGLEPLTVRDSSANNLAEALDFGLHDLSAPAISAPRGPFGGPCPPDLPGAAQPWQALRDFVRQEAAPLLSLL